MSVQACNRCHSGKFLRQSCNEASALGRISMQACNRCHSGKFLRRSSDEVSALSGKQAPAAHIVRQQPCSVSGHFRTPRVCRLRSSPFVWSGPNRKLGRFSRAPYPQSMAGPESSPEPAISTARQGRWPLVQVIWKCLAAVVLTCSFWSLHQNRSASSQLVAEPNQASVGWASEAVHSGQHTLSSTTTAAAHLHQQPAFASITFASIISHAQRTHTVQMLVYQVQRVRLFLKLKSWQRFHCQLL